MCRVCLSSGRNVQEGGLLAHNYIAAAGPPLLPSTLDGMAKLPKGSPY
jgi:hypothetical protein